MQQDLQQAPFPLLTWDEYWWTGTVQLPAWKGFGNWHGPDQSRSPHGSTDGSIEIRVWAPNDLPVLPTPAQAAAYCHLLTNQAAIRDTVLQALAEKYPARLAFCRKEINEQLSEVPGVVQLRELLGLTGINIFTTEKAGLAYVGYELTCTWDDYNMGVMTNAGHIVQVDGAGVAILESVALRDLVGQPPCE